MKVINVIDESEVYESEINTFVHGRVVVHKLKFLTEAQLSVKAMRESVEKDDWIDI